MSEVEEVKSRIAYLINDDGFVVDSIVVFSDEEFVDGNLVTFKHPQGISFFKMRWTGTEWTEGATQAEIEEMTRVESSQPTAEERIEALEEALLLMMMEG